MSSLRAFEAAARHLSFTRAALELNLTPTAVGHQIKKLETTLGSQVFIRNNNTLALTDAARSYLRVVRSALQDLSFASDRVADQNDDSVLTVQCLDAFAVKRLVPDLRDFHDRVPGLTLRLCGGQSLAVPADQQFDVAIWHGAGGWPGVTAHRLGTEEVFPVCSARWLANGPPLRNPEDLRSHTVIRTSSRMLRDEWPLWLNAANVSGLEFGPNISCDNPLTAMQAAEDGLGVFLGRSSVVSHDLEAGRLAEPLALRVVSPFSYYLVIPDRCKAMKKVQNFTIWLVARMADRSTP